MEKEESNNIFRNDEIDLFQIFNLLYLQKKIISYIVLSFVIVAVLFSIFIPNQYKSSTVLAPTQDSGSALTGMQSQVGGLASLAGISLGKGKADEATIALTVMRSWGFIESFLNEANISHEVYASTGWDKDSNKLIFDRSIYDPDKKFENFVNPQSVVWQKVETNFWKDYLKDLIEEFDKETNSIISRKILLNFEEDLKNFVQVCPKEMLDKLVNPITNKKTNLAS